MREADRIRIFHMVDSARHIVKSIQGQTRDDLSRDRNLSLALLKCFEIIGEAASRVSAETRESHPVIPWSRIIGMRNRLIHAYFEIDYDQVWRTAFEDVPSLLHALEDILRRDW